MGSAEAVKVNDGGVDVPQVDDLCLLVAILMKNSICTDEEENTDPHDERTEDLQSIRVEIPVETFNTKEQRQVVKQHKEETGHFRPTSLW